MSHKGAGFEAEKWKEVSRIYRRAMGLALGRKSGRAAVGVPGYTTKNEAEYLEGATEDRPHLSELGMAGMLRRRMRCSGAAAKGVLWSMRDLRVGI